MWRKVATLACLVILVAVNWAAVPVEASCASSTIHVAAPPIVFGKAITVAWGIAPTCDVIETGLLLGPDPTGLAPVGEVFYGFREFYVQMIPVAQSTQLWIAVRARDEDDRVIQSSPQSVQIQVPPPGLDDPAGSTTPLSFTGTDADFLRPPLPGSLYTASLRKVTLTEVGIFTANTVPGNLDGSRLVASPHPTEVRDELARGITVGGFTFPPDALGLDNAIARWNDLWASGIIGQFPRTGLYSVVCALTTPVPIIVSQAGCDISAPLVEYQEEVSDLFGVPTLRFARSTRSTLVYFIPKAPPGSQVLRARLVLLDVRAAGDFSTLRLNGKPPIPGSLLVFSVGPCRFVCTVSAEWDFTDEVRTLAAQGGGEFSLRIDPIAPLVFQGPGVSGSFALVAFRPTVHYPWAQGSVLNSLLLAYGVPACRQEITLTATLPSVRPQLTGALPGQTQSTIEASVSSCPPQPGSPASVVVTFKVQAPKDGTAEDGGHVHDGTRQQQTGTFTQSADKGGQRMTSCVASLDAQGHGSCKATYVGSQVSGVETITGSAAGFPDAQTKVRVAVPGLVELPQNPARYVLVGAPNNHAGTNDPCIPQAMAPTSRHFQNHFGQPRLNQAVQAIADKMRNETGGVLLRVNDMSLSLGGLFDIQNNWQPPHVDHRVSLAVDIPFTGVRSGTCAVYSQIRLQIAIRKATGQAPLIEADHFHAFIR